MKGWVERMYAQYSDVRPNCSLPSNTGELLEGGAAVPRKRFLHLLPVRKEAAILDIGCGYGNFLYFLQIEGYANTMGVDLNAQQLDVARSLGVRNVQCCEAREFLHGADSRFDLVAALDVLEHVPRDQVLEFLDAVYAALRPGGRFLCQVPNLAAFYNPVFYMDFSHETPFTAASLQQVLQLARFENIRVFPMGPVAHGLKSTLRCVLWKAITLGLQVTKAIEGGPRYAFDTIYTSSILAAGDKA